MILVNEIYAAEAAMDAGEVDAATIAELLRTLTLLLAPFAPFLAAELWEELGETSDVFQQPWPVADAELGAGERDRGAGAGEWEAGERDQAGGGCG